MKNENFSSSFAYEFMTNSEDTHEKVRIIAPAAIRFLLKKL